MENDNTVYFWLGLIFVCAMLFVGFQLDEPDAQRTGYVADCVNTFVPYMPD